MAQDQNQAARPQRIAASERLRENRLLRARPLSSFACKSSEWLGPHLDCGPVRVPFREFSWSQGLMQRGQANTANEIFETGVGTQRVQARPQQDSRVNQLVVALYEPIHGQIPVTKSRIDHRNL